MIKVRKGTRNTGTGKYLKRERGKHAVAYILNGEHDNVITNPRDIPNSRDQRSGPLMPVGTRHHRHPAQVISVARSQ
jgi:hypothetical protein